MLPLEGVRVVDWTIVQSGPCATQLMADLGAEVIKIESPSTGDSSRGPTRMAGIGLNLPNGHSYSFEVYNRNKKSVAVDLEKPEGKEIIYSLVKVSDVFVQNFRLGVAERLGLGYETLSKYNPSLVYASCTGYGLRGPRARKPALDPAVHAATGMMLGIGEPGTPPVHVPGALADMSTAMMLAYGIMTALYCRQRTGVGQAVHVSMLGTRVWMHTNSLLASIQGGRSRPRHARAKAPNPLYNYYCCKDDKWVLLAHLQPDKYWGKFCRVLGLERLEQDPRFHDSKVREQHCEELVAILDRTFATKTRDEWLQVLDATGEFVVSPILDFWEVVNDPQVLENDYLVDYDHPELGKIKETGIPVQFSKTPGSIRAPAPQLGQHTEEVLVDLLGLSWPQIEHLHDQRAIG